ncbi:16S rRNA (guanine(966)-N(2))-methyltransferase RsmD [Liquorilactobacillus mali]|uniref:Methyltransferase n=1 Tax=Liquorilactobacillus mali TaxID=1618 RepID=A0A0R2GC06_9LACO|nr:16S rRNA (guanine(966)-N(2))-methyltransferase RsmD [Liquorilactobacillus mali]KRN34349.1 methyltransferase [Liquorilactobacillus mali]MDN7144504.1 16S rRNA (guanine(966)-N(2))-methyltransferase RsmD [Liquorilactobacillus mali]MDV7757198.1 16S rRNA (guanine(966)-N(2))-methyltransferase RsmD [Liquorilactobacillus mali]
MRVIAGNYGGRRLKAVPGMKTRPTTDKVKESMFNIIGPYFEGGVGLDLFAGSGGLSIEAVSRGLGHAYLVDRQYQAIKTINENIAVTKEAEKFTVFKNDAERVLTKLHAEGITVDYLFLDPPYKQQKILSLLTKIVDLQLLNKDAVVVCETDQIAQLPDNIPNFELTRRADYGITEVIVYRYRGE